jgi:hypothetical protein
MSGSAARSITQSSDEPLRRPRSSQGHNCGCRITCDVVRCDEFHTTLATYPRTSAGRKRTTALASGATARFSDSGMMIQDGDDFVCASAKSQGLSKMPKSRGRKPKAKKVLPAPPKIAEQKVAKPPGGSKEQPKKDQVLNKPDLAEPTLAEAGIDKNATAPKQKWSTLRRLFRRQTIDH